MRKSSLTLSISFLLGFVLFGLDATAQERAKGNRNVPVLGSQVRTMHSTNTGRDYDLYIHLPSTFDKDNKKYPVVYVLDGQWDFKLMDSVLGGLVYDKFVPPMVIVGITYSGENPDYNELRAMDYTPTPTRDVKGSGGGPKFLKFIKDELIPFVEKNYRGDPAHRVLTGSSYGGLFTLYALFSEPSLFSGYVALSPAVAYDDQFSFKQESKFAQAHKELPVKLFIAVSDDEELTKPVQDFMRVVSGRRYKGLKLETRTIEGERHASNKPEGYNRGVKFLWK